jgi:NhaP-type Na+/H+ or K+/H+ antiporter
MRRSLFGTLGGPRGVVPAALPLNLHQQYRDDLLLHWGLIILTTTVVTVLAPVILETGLDGHPQAQAAGGSGTGEIGIQCATARK